MPTYVYRCPSCNDLFERKHGFNEELSEQCRSCGSGTIVKVFHPPAVSFKGGGWGGRYPNTDLDT